MNILLPTLLKPQLYTLGNFWRRRTELKQFWIRNGTLGIMTVAIMYGAYRGCLWVLFQTETQLDFAYFHPGVLLGLLLALLSVVLVVTNTAAATGALFLGQDLEFIIASPIEPYRFFIGKLGQIFISSSWMTAVFLLPIIIAFGVHFHAPFEYYVLFFLALIPFFVIPAAIAFLIASLIALVVPANWKRELLVLVCILALVGLYSLARMLTNGIDDGRPIDTRDFFRFIGLMSIANTSWSPAYWVASGLGEILAPHGRSVAWHFALLFGTATALLAADFLLFRFLYFKSYSRAALHGQAVKVESRKSQLRLESLLKRLPPPIRAVAVKEVKTSSRDAVQAIQGLLICVICALYLYVLSFEGLFQRVIPDEQRNWWRIFLVVCNLCIEAFVVTAIANRLVFPSVSREGRSFWCLQTAPIAMRKLLSIKNLVWLVFVGAFTSAVFGIAAILLTHSAVIALFKILLNLATTIGVVGLAVGFGAYFANFEWEHPAQLIMGFGNLVYMVVAVLLIGFNLLGGAMILLAVFKIGGSELFFHPRYLAFVTGGFVLAFVSNMLVARWALSFGAEALQKRK